MRLIRGHVVSIGTSRVGCSIFRLGHRRRGTKPADRRLYTPVVSGPPMREDKAPDAGAALSVAGHGRGNQEATVQFWCNFLRSVC